MSGYEQQVGPEMLVEDLVREFPASVAILRKMGIICIMCGEPVWGTIGELIESKGKEVAPVLEELNEALRAAAGAEGG